MSADTDSLAAHSDAPARPPRVYHWAQDGSDISYCGIDVSRHSSTPPSGNGPKPVLCDTCKFVADLEDKLDAMYFGRDANQ